MTKVWSDFCDGLKRLGDVIEGVEGLNDLDRAEGYRYLTRLLRLALEMNLEHGGAEHASFYSLSHETAKNTLGCKTSYGTKRYFIVRCWRA